MILSNTDITVGHSIHQTVTMAVNAIRKEKKTDMKWSGERKGLKGF